MESYEARAFRFVELCAFGDWRMKLYGIAWHRELPRAGLLEAAKRIASEELKNFAQNEYHLGFIGAHDGRDAAFVFVDFWRNENKLFDRFFLSRGDDADRLAPAKDSDSSVCVWDLALQLFERAAWIKHVLMKPDAPDFDAYLNG